MKNLEILKPFIEHDSFKEWMREPQYQKGYAYATDALTMVRTKSDPFEPENIYEVNLSDWFRKSTRIGTVTSEEIKKALSTIPAFPEYPELNCKDCDGAGDIECNYGHYHDCKECMGNGTIIDKSKGSIGFKYQSGNYISINGNSIDPNFLKRLLPLSENWRIYRSKKEKHALLATSDKFEVIIMRYIGEPVHSIELPITL